MKLQIISDLHLEFYKDGGKAFCAGLPVLADNLVVAGDLMVMNNLQKPLEAFGWLCGRFKRVFYVPGNHEYYHSAPAQTDAVLAKCALRYQNLQVLNCTQSMVGGQQIIGCSLWFPKTHDEHYYRQCLADFKYIKQFVPWVHDTHVDHMEFLRRNIEPDAIVITHHLPHPKSTPAQFKGSATNRFFCAEDAMEFFYSDSPPPLWIHGHTHTACDYVVGSTRVVCNPLGYPGENPGEYEQLVVEL